MLTGWGGSADLPILPSTWIQASSIFGSPDEVDGLTGLFQSIY